MEWFACFAQILSTLFNPIMAPQKNTLLYTLNMHEGPPHSRPISGTYSTSHKGKIEVNMPCWEPYIRAVTNKMFQWSGCRTTHLHYLCKGHFTHETESRWPVHFKHSHWWKRRSRSKFASHYTWGTNGVLECKIDVKSTWIPTWHWMDHVSWSRGLFSKTTSWR